MCGCKSNETVISLPAVQRTVGGVDLQVGDMTCGHCAGKIKTAVEAGLPGTQVRVDLGAKVVSVQGTLDKEAVKRIIVQTGYAPSEPV